MRKKMTIEPADGWWERSQVTPDLRPSFSSGMGSALEFESQATGIRIRFPWWDSAKDTEPFLNWLRTAPAGSTFSDLDQGWSIDAIRLGDRFHFLDRDWEREEVHANVVVERAAFLKALHDAGATG
jgi:hypothetical protein